MDTSTTQNLAQLLARAEQLTHAITSQAERDQESFDAGYREALALCRAMYDHGIQVGRAQVIEQITTAQAQIAHDLALDDDACRKARLARESPDITLPCTHPGCRGWHLTHHHTRRDKVLCFAHQPTAWCPTHNDNDRCAYLAELTATRRPDYQGGPAPWPDLPAPRPAGDPWATLPKATT